MLAKAVSSFDALPEGATWCSSRSGTASAASCSATATRSCSAAATNARSPATSPSSSTPLRSQLPPRCVVDGEIVVPGATGLDFDALQQRIHPADSRVRSLAAETPASFVAFDLLALGDEDLPELPFSERRDACCRACSASVTPPVHLTPATTRWTKRADWFERFEGAGLDGVVAKRLEQPYQPDKRVMFKVKHQRTADCVVAGFRMHKDGDGVGSLLLGLYDDDGTLHHVGVAALHGRVPPRARGELAPLRKNALDDHPWRDWADDGAGARAAGRMPGAVSRWNAQKDLSWDPLRHRAGVRGRVRPADERAASATTPTSCAGAPTAHLVSAATTQLEVAVAGRARRGVRDDADPRRYFDACLRLAAVDTRIRPASIGVDDRPPGP